MTQKNIVRGQSVSAEKVAKAKELRKNITNAEKILWQQLRGNKLGWHFRRQQIIHGFIVDFYCHQKSLIIEVDGEIHDHQIEEDRLRENALKEYGFKIILFANQQVEKNLY
ncbi:MAG: endonuclease domain-containing protein [Anaerolineae bacterium]|nr:endonuclease domain-containing protein [Anaerolineae bacterium]MBT7192228.1 endonuclease domain-containing protein [Anaerolineae bacterium]MBT7990071.1 endonuclease domain-containing protein [Anaerolineae bacterium]